MKRLLSASCQWAASAETLGRPEGAVRAVPWAAAASRWVRHPGSAVTGAWPPTTYDAAKGAVANLTHAMALDHGSAEGVRVNAVHPSMISTDMSAGFLQNDAIVGRRAQPDTASTLRRSSRGGFRAHVPGQCDGELSERGPHPRRRQDRRLERQSAHRVAPPGKAGRRRSLGSLGGVIPKAVTAGHTRPSWAAQTPYGEAIFIVPLPGRPASRPAAEPRPGSAPDCDPLPPAKTAKERQLSS